MIAGHWTVGAVEVWRVDSANFVLPTDVPMPSWAVPAFTPSVDETPIAFSAIVIKTPSETVVVDPWLVDEAPRTNPHADGLLDSLLADLVACGVAAEFVGTVVLSHVDGIGWSLRQGGDGGWVPTFPNARYLIPAAELAAIDGGAPINGAEHLGPLRPVLQAVGSTFSVAAEISLVDAPGHNPGHLAVRIESGDDLAISPGHLVLSLLQVADPAADAGELDLVTASATRRTILDELADRHGLLLTTLIGGPGGGRVERDGTGYRLVV